MIERQVIVTWERPEDKLPPEFHTVVCTVSGKAGNITYDHAFMLMEYANDGCGWLSDDVEFDELTVHAWCDLGPYGGK